MSETEHSRQDTHWLGAPPESDHLVPPIGQAPAEERMLRANWLSSLVRSPGGHPLLYPDFVGPLGPSVRIVDVREADEVVGPFGHIPGADWIPAASAKTLAERLPKDTKVVLVSRAGERSGPLASELESHGMPFVASLAGGMVGWRLLGFATSHERAILTRRDALSPAREEVPAARPLPKEAIEAHVGDPRAVRWIKAASLLLHGRLSCVDGRDDTGVIGTPGGDAGELALALAAIERLTGKQLDDARVRTILKRRLHMLGRFYLHSDIHAANTMITAMRADSRFDDAIRDVNEAMQWRRFFAKPPEALHDAVAELLVMPAHVGCGHLRLTMLNGEDYGARPELVQSLVGAFVRARWAGALDTELVVLPLGHEEGAVVNVRVKGGVHSFTPVPMISPRCAGSQMFVNHPEVTALLRREFAAFLTLCEDLTGVGAKRSGELLEAINELGAQQMGATLTRLAKGLPIYDLLFDPETGSAEVSAVGTV